MQPIIILWTAHQVICPTHQRDFLISDYAQVINGWPALPVLALVAFWAEIVLLHALAQYVLPVVVNTAEAAASWGVPHQRFQAGWGQICERVLVSHMRNPEATDTGEVAHFAPEFQKSCRFGKDLGA